MGIHTMENLLEKFINSVLLYSRMCFSFMLILGQPGRPSFQTSRQAALCRDLAFRGNMLPWVPTYFQMFSCSHWLLNPSLWSCIFGYFANRPNNFCLKRLSVFTALQRYSIADMTWKGRFSWYLDRLICNHGRLGFVTFIGVFTIVLLQTLEWCATIFRK